MRDNDLARGDNSSEFPSGFEDWALSQLEEIAKQPIYKKSISGHLDQINLVITNKEIEWQDECNLFMSNGDTLNRITYDNKQLFNFIYYLKKDL